VELISRSCGVNRMKDTVVEIYVQKQPLNAISLKNAVLCAECDVVSDSSHDHCRVCGSRSLFNISRILGGALPRERAMLVSPARPPAPLPHPVLTFPRPRGEVRENHRRQFKSG
jgi:hypothetical protein